MPIKSEIDHQKKLVTTTNYGQITIDDLVEYQTTTWTDPSIYSYNELFDFAGSDYGKISFEDLVKVAEKAAKVIDLDPNSRFAFLVHNTQHQSIADFYLAAKAFTTGPSREIEAFSNRDKALAWLNQHTP